MSETIEEMIRAIVREELAKVRPDDEPLLSTRDAAKLARVTVDTVRRWITAGDLDSVRAGRSHRVPRAALDAMLSRNQRSTTTAAPVVCPRTWNESLTDSFLAAQRRLICDRGIPYETYTYVIQLVGSRDLPIKIGRSINPLTRLRDLQSIYPYQFEVVRLLHGGDAELILHQNYSEHRIHGEWFCGIGAAALWDGAQEPHKCAACEGGLR